jgi:nucleotide-binding universal stress UspA family protein
MAKMLGVGITLIRSISPMAYGDRFADYVPSMYEDLASEIETNVRDYLASEASELRDAGVSDVSEKTIDGYAGSAILDEVGDDGDSLMVMATHGRSGIGRWVLGSVADRVVRHSPGPVLIVPSTRSRVTRQPTKWDATAEMAVVSFVSRTHTLVDSSR